MSYEFVNWYQSSSAELIQWLEQKQPPFDVNSEVDDGHCGRMTPLAFAVRYRLAAFAGELVKRGAKVYDAYSTARFGWVTKRR